MVPWVPINTMLYTNPISKSHQVKCFMKKIKKTGTSNNSHNQESMGSQFFRDLNMLIREKNSAKICPTVGFTKAPCSSCHPYDGVFKMISMNAINKYLK